MERSEQKLKPRASATVTKNGWIGSDGRKSWKEDRGRKRIEENIQILNNAPFTFLKRIFSEGSLLGQQV